jgi:hypothetical protein
MLIASIAGLLTGTLAPAAWAARHNAAPVVATSSGVGVVQIGGGLLALATLVVISLQLRASARATRQQRSVEVLAVWNEREFRTILGPAFAFIGLRDVDDCISKIRSWVCSTHGEERCLLGNGLRKAGRKPPPLARTNDLWHVLGAVEGVAVRYNEDEIDRRWVALTLGPSLVSLLDSSLWLVAFLRAWYESPNLSTEWVATVRDLCRRPWPVAADELAGTRELVERPWDRPSRGPWKRFFPRRLPHPIFRDLKVAGSPQKIRIICLPPEPRWASDDDWRRASSLSSVLASAEAQDSLCARLAEREVATSGWTAIVVPKSPLATDDETRADKRLERELNARLSVLTPTEIDHEVTFLCRR